MERVRKRLGKKSTSANNAREAFGDVYEKEMPALLCIEDYNQHMGGIDIFNQHRSYYDTFDLISHLVAHAFLGTQHDDHQCLSSLGTCLRVLTP